MADTKNYIITLFIFLPIIVFGQICEPVYTVAKLVVTNSSEGQMTDPGTSMTAHITIGQTGAINNTTNQTTNSVALGFWANFLTEPVSPVLRASDGDFQDMVMVEWDIQNDLTGPPVTVEEVTLLRNDFILTTLPISQTQYLDFNVFPGADYVYEAIVSNDLGSSGGGEDGGFLNPNGVITGQVVTNSANPVHNTKVILEPNLGKSIKFEGDGYMYWFDGDKNGNRQFSGLENDYTIEMWLQSSLSGIGDRTIFAAVDSASANDYVKIGITDEGFIRWTHMGTTLTSSEPYAGPGQPWHHLAIVFNQGQMTLYLDGEIVGEGSGSPIDDTVEMIVGKNSPNDHSKYFRGYLDDLRIWSFPVEWQDIRTNNDLTLRGDEDGLIAYWKLDEVEGDNIFDLSPNKLHGSICNVVRTEVFAPVYVGDLTDTLGNYAINGIYYGTGTTFTVSPSQESIVGRSLDFDGIDDEVNFELERINLRSGFTIEGWFKTPSSDEMTLFFAEDPATSENGDDAQVRFRLVNGIPTASYFNASLVGPVALNDNLWHHWAATLSVEDSYVLTMYIDGDQVASEGVSSNDPILEVSRPGFASNGYDDNFFEGHLDEIRVWSGPRNLDQISGTMNTPLNGEENGLLNYWNFNDGAGLFLNDIGSSLSTGTILGVDENDQDDIWTIDIPLEEIFEHYYDPESRQVTLNYSNTAVDLVNFVDQSLIPISGYVRYENTSCFIQNAEILVDGESLIPNVYTNEEGKFIVDLEPGSAGKILTAVYRDHEFLPPLIELPLITTPMTGLYFEDTKTFEASGIVAGGLCKFPITSSAGDIVVTFSTVDGCYERVLVPDTLTGTFTAADMPPVIYNVTAYHPNPAIIFDADTLSLQDNDRTREFLYQAPIETDFVSLPESEKESDDFPIIITQRGIYDAGFEVFETYTTPWDTNRCQIQAFNVDVFDNISDTSYSASVGADTDKIVSFTGNSVNLLDGGDHPYQRSLQIVVKDSTDRTATSTFWAFIEGDEKIEGVNFSTTTSKMPWYVLRAPYGDGSSTILSTGETICNNISTSNSLDNAGNFDNTIHLGTTQTLFVGVGVGFGAMVLAGKLVDIGYTLDIGANLSWSTTVTDVDETCNCITATETYSTSGDGLITGDDATVFVGGGYSVDMGSAYSIFYDTSGDSVKIIQVITSDTKGVVSTYIHSKYYIKNALMPDLLTLYENNNNLEALEDYNYWQAILDKDSVAIENAVFSDDLLIGAEGESSSNISFDAGSSLEYSYETSNSHSITNTVTYNDAQNFYLETGVDIMGLGWDMNAGYTRTFANENTTQNDTTSTKTIGFILDDDDPGDGFAFSIKSDPEWGMPVFDLIGGQSSCPYEEGTFRRQMTALSPANNYLDNIPPDEPAVFTLLLGNMSDTEETQAYTLSVLSESNPYGAMITASGSNLASGVTYEIDYGQQIEVSVSVYRGPEEYDYEDITLQFAPPCEDDIAGAIGGGTEPQNASFALLTAHFEKPCSETNIFLPETGWVVTSSHSDGDSLYITLNDFDVENQALESIDLQYRTAGLGDWFTAVSLSRDSLISLGESFAIVIWNIKPSIVPDGEYDLRSVAKCTGEAVDGFSETITGLIDRNAPSVFGLPEPINGILGPDDLIRITFNEDIDCEAINVGNSDLAFFNTVTGSAVDFNYTCGENMITIEANVPNHYIENRTFRAEVNELSDLLDNSISDPITWEFFVNRNPIEWVGTNISNIVLYVEDEYSTNRQLVNNGGSNRSWYMHGGRDISPTAPEYPGNALNLPSWLDYSPGDGTLTPGSSQDVTLGLAEGLNFGEYQTVIYAGVNGLGDEPMIIDIRKLCHEPDWELNPSEFQYSMNITGMLRTRPSPAVLDSSSDVYDMVGVFVGEELRGVGTIEYLPDLETISNFHPYEVFLTVYSNVSEGDDLSFRVWDASGCVMLGQIEEELVFSANDVLGSLTNPINLTATSEVLSDHMYPEGWTWLSINTYQADMSINTILSTFSPLSGDLIKSQTEFAQYSAESNIWVGGLDTLDHRSTYLLKLGEEDTLTRIGYPIDVELDTITINQGWNWVGYTPQESYLINDALASLDTVVITGNIVKSQTGYAQFLESYGWYGSMNYMDPGEGYLINTASDGVLLYPFTIPQNMLEGTDEPPVRELADNAPEWDVNPSQYSGTMNITGELIVLDEISANPLDMVGAFINDECRGVGQPIYIEPLGKYIVFLTVYGDENETSNLQFHAYSEANDEILYAPETIPFELDNIIGNLEEPYIWDTRFLEAGDTGFIPNVFSLSQNYPNPFNPSTTISFGVPQVSQINITIYDILGKKVATLVNEKMEPGYYSKIWDSRNKYGNEVAAGIYFYQIHAEGFTKTRKLILLK